MANVATLSLDSSGKRTELRSAKYRVPLFWLCCFERSDVILGRDEDGESEVLLATTPVRALGLIDARKTALRGMVSNLDAFLPAWVAIIRGLEEGRLWVDATEVLLMTESTELSAPVHAALGFFEEPTEAGAAALLDLTSLGDHIDRQTGEVSTPPRKRVRDVLPEVADHFGPEARLPEDPAVEALMGHAIPGRSAKVTGRWHTRQTLAVIAGVAAAAISASGYLSHRRSTPFEAIVLVSCLVASVVLWKWPRR